MVRIAVCVLAAVLAVSLLPAAIAPVIAQPAPTAATTPADAAKPPSEKPPRFHLTREKLKALKAKWNANKPKLKACRQDAKAKGLAGDDRWFYMQDCMTKS